MGWLTAVFFTTIAGYIIQKLLVQRYVGAGNIEAVKPGSDQGHDPRASVKTTANTLSPKTSEEHSLRPDFAITSPPPVRMKISEVDVKLPAATMAEPLAYTSQEPKAAMLPPPSPSLNTRSSPHRLPPPKFSTALAPPPRPGNGFVRPPPSAAASLRVPVTKPLPNASLAPTSSIMPPGKQVSRKVILEPGHSPLDWAALTNNPNSKLRGKDAPGDRLLRITPAQLKAQHGRKGRDAWTVYQGKVYNITPYVPFHPGGAGEIMRGAGKDSVKLFMEAHPWVNWDGMLSECLVGILVGEDEGMNGTTNKLEEMD